MLNLTFDWKFFRTRFARFGLRNASFNMSRLSTIYPRYNASSSLSTTTSLAVATGLDARGDFSREKTFRGSTNLRTWWGSWGPNLSPVCRGDKEMCLNSGGTLIHLIWVSQPHIMWKLYDVVICWKCVEICMDYGIFQPSYWYCLTFQKSNYNLGVSINSFASLAFQGWSYRHTSKQILSKGCAIGTLSYQSGDDPCRHY